MNKRLIKLTTIVFYINLSIGCSESKNEIYQPKYSKNPIKESTVYIIGVHPLHNPQHLFEVFEPLVSYLGKNIENANFTLEASRNYASYDEKLYAKKFHFALPNPFQTINAIDKGYRVIAKMGDDSNFRGVIIIRKDSGINEISDLKGKSVSYPAPTALAATMMPQYYMQQNGIDIMTDIENKYVGSQESSIMNVFLGNTSAASTWPPPWRAFIKKRPELAEQLEIKWQTEPLINNSFLARGDIDIKLSNQVKRLLANLHNTQEGKAMLEKMELSRFELSSDQDYEIVRLFIAKFSEEVRQID